MKKYIDELKKQIEKTGHPTLCPLKHLVVTENQLEKLEEKNIDLDFIADQLVIDFISVEKQDNINFLHIASVESLEFIEKNGLKEEKDGSDWIPDLGSGVYVIEERNIDAMISLQDYMSEDSRDEILIVIGQYIGKYTECIYGEGHKGYLALKEGKGLSSRELDIEESTVEEFLSR